MLWGVTQFKRHTNSHPTACLLLKLSRVGPGLSLDGRTDAAERGVGGPVGGKDLKNKQSNAPGQ